MNDQDRLNRAGAEEIARRAELAATLEIFEVPQGSPEWFELRRGLPTSSEFAAIMANSSDRKGRASYMRRLAGEIITGDIAEMFANGLPAPMRRGQEQEDEARRTYSLITDNVVRRIGFARDLDKGAGCSTDGLIGEDGVLELKSMRADLLIETIEKDEFPNAHYWQCQGALWILRRQWCDLAIYCPKMPLFIKRVVRDEDKCAKLAAEIQSFRVDLLSMVARVKTYGGGV